MRLIQFDTDFFDSVRQTQLKGGVDYLVTQLFAGYYSSICDGYLSIKPYPLKKFSPDKNWNGKRILIHRSVGGAGDLLFLTPLFRALKQKWPRCHITLYCYEMYHWILKDNPHLDACVDFQLPMTPKSLKGFDGHIDLEDAIEYSKLSHTHSAVDVFADAAGIVLEDKTPVYEPDPAIVEKIAQRFPKKTQRVAIALKSGSVLRDYPMENFIEITRSLLRNSIEVFLLGGPRQTINGEHPLYHELLNENPLLSWEENVALIKTCDLVVGPDSSAIHFAGTMGVPALGLYAAFPADLRIQGKTQAIQASGPCAPCFAQDRGGIHFPPGGPCNISRKCDILASIPLQQITAKIFEMLASPQPEPAPSEGAEKKVICLVGQPCGIGDIMFIQKILHHFADKGFRVVLPIFEQYAWLRYYLAPHADISYPLIFTSAEKWQCDFEHFDLFLSFGEGAMAQDNPDNAVYGSPVLYRGEGGPMLFLSLSTSYQWRREKMMPSKYLMTGVDHSDWADYVHLKRRSHIERELYYDVLGLKDDSRYTLVNENASSHSLPLDVPGNVVKLREIDGFTLFDWAMVIEKAAQIVTIDTSLVILTEVLKQQKPLYMLSRSDPPSFDSVKDILRLDWTLVPTPADLKIAGVS
jgi:ADP-heptose:LPS heptosyltransferase